jgi:hypothetical protein
VVTDDIVTRLREHHEWFGTGGQPTSIWEDAADEIERLRTLGDALASTGGQHGFDEALDNWKEMRGE